MKKTLCFLITLLLAFGALPSIAETITEDRVAEAMIRKVLQEYPEYVDVELEMKYLNYNPPFPEYDQDYGCWTADLYRKSDDFHLFQVTYDVYHDDIRPEDIHFQYHDPDNWKYILWHWENKVNMGPFRCWPIEYKAEYDAWMRASITDYADVAHEAEILLLLSHVNGLPDENCLPLEEAIEAAQHFVVASGAITKEEILLRRTLQQFWVDDPENPYWCITICKNERTFLREWLVAVDAHTGECQWMHVDPYGYYQLGENPGNG